jgi:hypothetical protein
LGAKGIYVTSTLGYFGVWMDIVSILLGIVSIISVLECYGMYASTKMARQTIASIPLLAKNAAIGMLKDPEMKKELVSMFLDQEFMEATSKTIFESLKSGIYGIIGVDKKNEKTLSKALLEDGAAGGLLDMLPDKMKNGKFMQIIKERPELLEVGLKMLAPYLGQQSASIPQVSPVTNYQQYGV